MRPLRLTRALTLTAALLVALAGGSAVDAAYLRPAPQPLIDIWPRSLYVGKPIQFRTLAHNAQRPIIRGSWDFGDGEMSADIWSAQHTYSSPGTYNVVLTVIDQDGQQGQAAATVVVGADLPPTPQFVVTPRPPEAGDTVSFAAAPTTDETDDLYGLPLSYSWEVTGPESFTSSFGSFTRTLSVPGTYEIELAVVDSNGGSATATDTLVVEPGGTYADGPPTAWPDVAPVTGAVAGRDAVAFDGSGSTDPGGPLTAYEWSFGDGTVATGASATHTYVAAGEYLVTLVVTDADGRTATNHNVVNVDAGELLVDVSASPVTGAAVTFDASDSYVAGSGVSYFWVFGDGWWSSGEVVTHEYVLPGTYSVDLYAANAEGDVVALTEIVVVAPGTPPVLTNGKDVSDPVAPAATIPASTAIPPGAPVVGPPSTPLGDGTTVATPAGRTVVGTSAADALSGTAFADRLSGGAGNDVLTGGRGRDVLEGGSGNDIVHARDGEVDTIRCGAGRDTVRADKRDRVAKDCESVRRA